MTEEQGAAARRIMNRLGEDSRLPIVNIREGDVSVLLGFPLTGLFVGGSTGVDFLGIALLGVGFFLGVTTVYAAPPHLTAWEWLQVVGRYVFRRPQVTHSYRTEDSNPSTEGGLTEYTSFSIEESTQGLTNVERAWPGAAAIERTDGTMEAFIELESGCSEGWVSQRAVRADRRRVRRDGPYLATESGAGAGRTPAGRRRPASGRGS